MEVKYIDDKSRGFKAYDVLGIDSKSTMSDNKSAYKKMLIQYHPDKNILLSNSSFVFKSWYNIHRVFVMGIKEEFSEVTQEYAGVIKDWKVCTETVLPPS